MAGVRPEDRCRCGAADRAGPPVGLKANEGAADRVVRVVLGAGVLTLAFVGPQTPWAWLGLLPLLTGLVGFCPLYAALGFSTTGRKAGA